ncbi:MAG: hypothetical protein M5R37_02230 [Melioribacteraceae bacterium]|nr:hypothetical protein [Melioribacteraceae bacterium]
MVYPKSQIKCIVIEGSKEKHQAGEYVIDVAEYSDTYENNYQEIAYYQLKHTTLKRDIPFNLSDLKSTIEGFSKRYVDITQRKKGNFNGEVTFTIVTNRPINPKAKEQINLIGLQKNVSSNDGKSKKKSFEEQLKRYTGLEGKHLQKFCSSLKLIDSEGDYNTQRYMLQAELSQVIAGSIENSLIDTLIALVKEKAMPSSNGEILKEDILQRLGVTSPSELFPAPPEFEKIDKIIQRKQYDNLRDTILKTDGSIIIHAEGGVGKSIAARHIADSLPKGSFGITYDCFGGGKYRNRSKLRHHHQHALIQIANELATVGLCAPIIPRSNVSEEFILRQFLGCLTTSITSLKRVDKNANLIILIDAADNAEMAALEYEQNCFVHELLREEMPNGCKLVALCRTERLHLLKPSDKIPKIPLEPFNKEETFAYLKKHINNISEDEALEFHRLTGGNPRVQANALNVSSNDISLVLKNLSPTGTTIDEQIQAQLDSAILKVKETHSESFQNHIDKICTGLAILPPFVPLRVLSAVAGVEESTIKSFIADLGRPLWLTDTSVQFRDEPTETWFREKFSASQEQISSYISKLIPLAATYPYVAETLPTLFLQARMYDELIELALSDKYLPEDSPIDKRNIRVYRLQFAFKAALRLKRYADAVKLALLAGEEMAGDERQMELLQGNIDLIAPLQSEQRVQELAFKRMFRSHWNGSENVFSAALLSSIEDFKGEARVYLRSAINWLHLYFEERKKDNDKFRQEDISDNDIVEIIFAYSNLFEVQVLVDFISSWRPKEFIYSITSKFIRRLVDTGNFDLINEIAGVASRHQYIMLAITKELLEVGSFVNTGLLKDTLAQLIKSKVRIPKPVNDYTHKNTISEAIVSFAEVCAKAGLSKSDILKVLNYYFPTRAIHNISSSFQESERSSYLRAVALRSVLLKTKNIDIEQLIPKKLLDKRQKHNNDQEVKEFKGVVGGLLPWYIFRTNILLKKVKNIWKEIEVVRQHSQKATSQRWHENDFIQYEISHVYLKILAIMKDLEKKEITKFFDELVAKNSDIRIHDRLDAVRTAFRSQYLSGIRKQLEISAREIIEAATREYTDTRANWYIDLSRAVLPICKEDAAVYFDYAIESVSKFGDEISERWGAISALGDRCADNGSVSPELAYRFLRCAELIGDNVAREKYWDRNDAIRICARLSPVSALAGLSRWRDRDVGWFFEQLSTLAEELVISKSISPSVVWSLTPFLSQFDLISLASVCIENLNSKDEKQNILDQTVRYLRLQDSEESNWHKLKEIAEANNIDNPEIDAVLDFYSQISVKEKEEKYKYPSTFKNKRLAVPWKKITSDLDLTTVLGIDEVFDRIEKYSSPDYKPTVSWEKIYESIDEKDAVKFLDALIHSEKVDSYDIRAAINLLPNSWRQKVSVKRNWNNLLKSIAKKFALEFTNLYSLKYFLNAIHENDSNVISIFQEGIIDGLSQNIEHADARSYFGFIRLTASLVSPTEAQDLLDFGLSRFEIHIDDDYADGNWDEWLIPPNSLCEAFSGTIWAALGSPRSEIRWRAVHSVCKLAEANCRNEIVELMKWMQKDVVCSFGCKEFPFYNLHARLYLLIALARISLDCPEVLKSYNDVFVYHALNSIPHVLIQKFSSKIAMNIEKAFPKTYSSETLEQLHKVCKSQLPIKELESFNDKLQSPWHLRGEVNQELKFYHGWDIDRYWYERLGGVFGISAKQVEDLTTNIIINDWGIENDGGYKSDPRSSLWRSSYNERETYHSHGSYPRTDTYSFYLSYHSMFVIAGKLLKEMPIIHRENWYDDEWLEWFERHLLTRKDGKWLADRRDCIPLLKRSWLQQKEDETWFSEIHDVDFLDGLLNEYSGKTWVNVSGNWSIRNNGRTERYSISTALVNPQSSRSLLHALNTCSNPYDYKLPDYEEEGMEININSFKLTGWIWRGHIDGRLDEYDPLSAEITYPPYQLGESIRKNLKLSSDDEWRKWYIQGQDNPCLICDIWSSDKIRYDEDPYKHGIKLNASLDFLKKMCKTLNCEVIIEVQISRSSKYESYKREKNEQKYKSPFTKVYILNSQGQLRDEKTNYKLREIIS